MNARAFVIGGAVLTFAIAGCASSAPRATQAVNITTPTSAAAPTGPLLLAAFDHGVGAVRAGDPSPVWLDPDAVAAPDGSAVFAVHHDADGAGNRLVGINPRTGVESSASPLAPGLSISAVSPDGRWVALTDRQPGYGDQGRTSTEVVVFETRSGVKLRDLKLTGDVQPEAFSTDGQFMFALNYLGDHYRVQTIDATGERYDTSDRNKTLLPEDMHGSAIHGVMSADRTLLATLYRNPGDDDEPAFVHVLDLEHHWSYCADLPAPFGTGPVGSDAIELTANDTVVVAATQADQLAEIPIDAVHTPANTPVPVHFRSGTITPPATSITALPGFEYVIAPVPA